MDTLQPEYIGVLSGLDAWIDNARFFDVCQALKKKKRAAVAPAYGMRMGAGSASARSGAAGHFLCRDEEMRCLILARHGDRYSRNALIRHGMTMLRYEARRLGHCGVDEADLIQEGIFGILRAIETFDLGRNVRFTTYAKWWVRDAMQTAAGRNTRHARPNPGGCAAVPSEDEDSCDTPSAAGESCSPYRDTPDDLLASSQHARLLHEALIELDENERLVLRARFGLHGAQTCTLEQLAAQLGMTSEGVRRVQLRAIKRIRVCLERRKVYAESVL